MLLCHRGIDSRKLMPLEYATVYSFYRGFLTCKDVFESHMKRLQVDAQLDTRKFAREDLSPSERNRYVAHLRLKALQSPQLQRIRLAARNTFVST